jgi:hypothetical protein
MPAQAAAHPRGPVPPLSVLEDVAIEADFSERRRGRLTAETAPGRVASQRVGLRDPLPGGGRGRTDGGE